MPSRTASRGERRASELQHALLPGLLAGAALAALGGSCHRVGGGNGSSLTPPALSNGQLARYYDVDGDGTVSAGDLIVVPFDGPIRLNGATVAALELAGAGDFGAGAEVLPGPAPNELQVVLGSGASLKTRQSWRPSNPDAHPATGIRLADDLPADAIESAETGADAVGGDPIDIVPGLTDLAIDALAGGNANALVVADLDRDGADDVVLGHGTGGFSVHLGDGAGGFALRFSAGASPVLSLAAADLDGDGVLDLYVGNEGADQIYLGIGDGTFDNSGQKIGAGATRALAVVDVDLDGDLDVVRAEEAVEWLRNDGSGFLELSDLPIVASGEARALVAARFDGDALPDLAVALPGELRVFLGAGGGAFVPAAALPGPADQARALAAGDVDRDGHLDLLVGNDGPDRLLLGDGQGGFSDAGVAFGDHSSSVLALVDLDADARLDIVVATSEGVRVYMRDAAGVFHDTGQLLAPAGASALAVLDCEGDGDLDLIATHPIESARVLRNSLAGTWGGVQLTPSRAELGGGVTFALACGDVDGDGDLDVLTGNNSLIELWRADGAGGFAAAEAIFDADGVAEDARVMSLALGDLDLDGDLDLVAGIVGVGTPVWENLGDGSFRRFPFPAPGFLQSATIALGDLDGDGDLDLVRGNMSGLPDEILINPGVGAGGSWPGFLAPIPLEDAGGPVGLQTGVVALVDADRDGDLDIFTGHGPGRPNRIWWNRTEHPDEPIFVRDEQNLGLLACRAVAIADLDGNGAPDLVTGNAGAERVLFNDGSGQFEERGDDLEPNSDTRDLALADIDGDGRLDLLVANDGTVAGDMQNLQIRLNLGSGQFTEDPWKRIGGGAVHAVLAFDLDRDGDVDIVVGNVLGQPNQVFINN